MSASDERPTVLYVEDDESNIEVAELRLSRRFDLKVARTDEEACAVLRQDGPSLHAVLMDIELRGSRLDGVQLTRLLRGKLPVELQPDFARGLPEVGAPVFIVTAFLGQYPLQLLSDAGADASFSKPVDFVKLSLALANASARAALMGPGAPKAP